MKKIAFITIHVGLNFGSVLQTIATSEALKTIGVDAICINYIPPRVANKKFWSFGRDSVFKSIKHFLGKLYELPRNLINSKQYSGYLKHYCKLSVPIYAEDNFSEKCPRADIYMVGSDQVWNIKHNQGVDKHYFFDGVEGKKISFASSIGYTDIGDEGRLMFKYYLSGFSSLSVRENSAVDLLASLGYNAEQLLDPTFIIDKEGWGKFTTLKPIVNKPYILIYTPYNTVDKSIIYNHARMIAACENLQVVTFSWTYYSDKDADKTVRFASPGDFLNLMNNAEYVITNSFHGTAFSINLNKRFWVFMPSGFTTRITSVLEKFNLSERLLTGGVPQKGWDYRASINYDSVNSILQQEREKSLQYLITAIQ